MTRHLLDPTGELTSSATSGSTRLANIDGARIALLDISKPRGNVFLDRIEVILRERGAVVTRHRKASYARVAAVTILDEVVHRSQAVIEALAD